MTHDEDSHSYWLAVVLLYSGIIYIINLFFPIEAFGSKPTEFQKPTGYSSPYGRKEASKESFFSASAGNDREKEQKERERQQQIATQAPSAFANMFAPANTTVRQGESDLESRDRLQATKEYNEKRDYLQKLRSEQSEDDALRSRAVAMREQVETKLNLGRSLNSNINTGSYTTPAYTAPSTASTGGGLFSSLFGGPEDNDPRFAQERLAHKERDEEERMREQARQMREQLEAQWGIKR